MNRFHAFDFLKLVNKPTQSQCIQLCFLTNETNFDNNIRCTYRLIFTLGSHITFWRKAQVSLIDIEELGIKTYKTVTQRLHLIHLYKYHPSTLQVNRKHGFFKKIQEDQRYQDVSNTIYDKYTYAIIITCFLEIDLRVANNVLYTKSYASHYENHK